MQENLVNHETVVQNLIASHINLDNQIYLAINDQNIISNDKVIIGVVNDNEDGDHV